MERTLKSYQEAGCRLQLLSVGDVPLHYYIRLNRKDIKCIDDYDTAVLFFLGKISDIARQTSLDLT